MGNKQIRTVFLSSTAEDLADYRKAACTAISALGYHCVRMEDFPPSSKSPEVYCKEQIRGCDVFVSLLGPCYGSSPKGKSVSFTEMEFDTAFELGIPCLVFMTVDDIRIPASLMRDARFGEQQAFREKVSRELVRGLFRTPDELMFQLAAALRDLQPEESIPSLKCVVLCGGTAKRLWPLTREFCKVLLPVAGKPVLDYTLGFLKKCPAIKETFLLTNPVYEEEIQSFLSKTYAPGVKVIVEPVDAAGGKLGPIGALRFFVERQGKDCDMVVLGGDNIFGFDLEEFVRFAYRKATSANAFYRFETGSDASEYGVATLSANETVTEFEEKQRIPAYLNVSTACYLLRQEESRRIGEYLDSGGDPFSLGSFIHWLVSKGIPIAGHVFQLPWFDVGNRRKLLDANKSFLIDIRLGNWDASTTINGPVQIEAGTSIRNSCIGPNVYVGPGVEIEDSTISDSIIMQGARVKRGYIAHSVIGAGSSVEGWLVDTVVGQGAQMMNEVSQGHAGIAD